MRRALLIAAIVLPLLLPAGPAAGAQPRVRVSDAPQRTVIVTVRGRPHAMKMKRAGSPRAAASIVRSLHANARRTQADLRAFLANQRALGSVTRIVHLWAINGLSVTAAPTVIAALAARPDVASVRSDEIAITPTLATAQPGIEAVHAPVLWSQGNTGQGVVVATLDTGVSATHPDLASRYRGGTNSWYDPYGQHTAGPIDVSGHGTATMGVLVGGDASGTTVGMAPSATWIAARIFNDSGAATATAIHQAFQWALDPDHNPGTDDAPQVVNGSWSIGSSTCDLSFRSDVQALRAAGILPVFAAGNNGPAASSSVSPANYPESFAVGAVDSAGAPYAYSGRGPSTCGGRTGVYPDLVAPGVNVHTTDLYGMYQDATGTSLAAPHVAGALALLLAARPDLSADQQAAALRQGAADLGAAGPDDTTGYGMLDVAASSVLLPPPSDTTPPSITSPALSPNPTNTTTSNGTAVVVNANATDAGGGIAAAEWFEGSDPGAGNGVPLGAADGSFGGPTESVSGTIDFVARGWAAGVHAISARAKDAAGNWGAPTTAQLTVVLPNDVFADGFESGSVGAWSGIGGTSTRLSVTTGSATGAYKLSAAISGGSSGYLRDTGPLAEGEYHATFAFDPNGYATGSGSTPPAVSVFRGLTDGGTTAFDVKYRRGSSRSPQVRLVITRSGGTTASKWFALTTGSWNRIAIDWSAGTAASARLYLNGTLRATLPKLNTSAIRIEEVRLGPQGTLPKTSGTLMFDAFASTRRTTV